jgi:hypothetical protein
MRLAFDTQLALMLRRLLVTSRVEISWSVTSVRRDIARSSTPTLCGHSFHGGLHTLNRSRRRFFLSLSLGLIATPWSHESTFATVIVCCSSGAFTRIVSRVVGPNGISARTP